MSKRQVIILRDFIVTISVLIACFFICRYNTPRMYVDDGNRNVKCELTEYEKKVILNMINDYKLKGTLI